MAPVPLNVSPALRPWRQAGVTHLLIEEEVRKRLFAAPTASAVETPAPQAVQSGQSSPEQLPRFPRSVVQRPESVHAQTSGVSPGVSLGSPPPRPTPVQTSAPGQAIPPRQATQPTQPEQGTPPGQATQSGHVWQSSDTVPCALLPEHWPAYWQELLARTPPQPTVVWTYPALSRDLGGAADAAHRDFLRRLLGDMGLPKGSHAFWPLNRYPYAPGMSEATVDAAMFMSGVSALNPDTVILLSGVVPPELGVFGGEKLTELRPLMPGIVQGRRFVVTPHVDGLIQDARRYAQLISFLKSLLSGR